MVFQNPQRELIFPELGYKIIGCAYKVHNELGGGHLEKSYHKSLIIELAKAGLQFISKKQIEILYGGSLVNGYEPDVIVEDLIVVEIKRKGRLTPSDFDQSRRYLKATNKQLALLIHFGAESVTIKRVVNIL